MVVPRARADELRAHLDWDRPVGTLCPSSATLQSDVEELVGRDVFTPREEADVVVRGVVEDRQTGVLIKIDALDRRGAVLGSRELTAPAGECASLRRALGLVLAFLLEQDNLIREPAPRRAVEPGVGVFAGVLSGTLPRADLGVGLALALDPPAPVRFRLDASYWLPVIAETPRGVGARFEAVRAGFSLCPRLLPSGEAVGLWVCAGAELGGLISTPRMLTGMDHQARLLVQPNVEISLAVRVAPHASVELTLGAVANALRPTFSYRRGDGETTTAFRPSLFGAILRAGLTIH